MATVKLTTHLWIDFAQAAIRQERRAWEARNSDAVAMAVETQESALCIIAARACLSGMAQNHLMQLVGVEKEKDLKLHLLSVSEVDADLWNERVLRLLLDRDDAVHHSEAASIPVSHPGQASHVSDERARYVAERASESVDVMLNDVIRLVVCEPSKAVAEWAGGHRQVLADLDERRADVER